jgi:hypothetical protein
VSTKERVAGTYSLTFLGFSSETAETLQKFKTICVADLELTVEKTQELLTSDALTKVLITSDSLPEVTRVSNLLTTIGAQVAIVSTSQELPPEENDFEEGSDGSTTEGEVELTFDLEHLLSEPIDKKKENKAPKEYHLDLESTEDLTALGFSDDGVQTTPSARDTISFDEELPPPTGSSPDPISQLVSDVAQVTSSPLSSSVSTPWSDNDLALQLGAPVEDLTPLQEISHGTGNLGTSDLGTSDLDFEDLDVLPAPLPKEMLSARSGKTPVSEGAVDQDSSSSVSSVTGVPEKPSVATTTSTLASSTLLDDIASAVDLAFEGEDRTSSAPEAIIAELTKATEEPTPEAPPVKQVNSSPTTQKINLTAALDSISFEKLLDDDPPPLVATPVVPPPAVTPPQPPAPSKEDEKVVGQPTSPSESLSTTPQPTPTIREEVVKTTLPEQPSISCGEDDPPSYVIKSNSTRDRDGFSKGQLTAIFLVGIAILALGNWMLTPEQEDPEVPSLEQVASATKGEPSPPATQGSSKTTNPPQTGGEKDLASSLAGSFSGEGFEITVTSSQMGATLSTKVLLTTPKPAEPSLEEIAQNAPLRIWLKRAESDVVQLKQVGTNEWSGTVPTYIFVERGAEGRRLPGTAMISGKLTPDGASGEISVEITYSPPGDTALPAPGSIIEAVGKDMYRVSVSGVVSVKRK